MRITLRAESARQAGIETAEDAASWEGRLPDPPRPDELRTLIRFGLSPQMRGDTLHLWLNDMIDQWFGVNNEHLVAALATAPDDAPDRAAPELSGRLASSTPARCRRRSPIGKWRRGWKGARQAQRPG